MIEISGLEFKYEGSSPLFSDFDWSVGRGESWSVLGASGCGKTTLLYLLAALKRPDGGTISIDGSYLDSPRPETGLILQNHGLLPWATVEKNIELGFRIRRFYGPDGKHAPESYRKDRKAEREQVRLWMELTGLAGLAGRYPHQLSGGQQQRTAIARTLALEPDLLLMDEPFSSLDAPTRSSLSLLVRELEKERYYSRILVTHSIEEALDMGEKILLLRGGGKKGLIFNNGSSGPSREKLAREIHSALGEDIE